MFSLVGWFSLGGGRWCLEFFEWWWVVVGYFGCVAVGIFWVAVGGGGSWWIMVGGGGWWHNL